MSSEYTVRIGAQPRTKLARPKKDIYALPFRAEADDGRVLLHAGTEPVRCGDCPAGRLQWAEAGYSPWHRICDVCGSHWDLHPVTWGPGRAGKNPVLAAEPPSQYAVDLCRALMLEEGWDDDAIAAEIARLREAHPHVLSDPKTPVRWVDGKGLVLLDPTEPLADSGRTWGDLLACIRHRHWREAAKPQNVEQYGGMIVVPCAWVRRARFYP